jgi:hypothetical protein
MNERIEKLDRTTQKRLHTTKCNWEDRHRLDHEESPEDKKKRLAIQHAMYRWLREQEKLIGEAFWEYRDVWSGPSYYNRYTDRPIDLVKVRRKGKALIKRLRYAADLIEKTQTGEHPLYLTGPEAQEKP